MPVTDQDIAALAHLACRLRAETPGCNAKLWDHHGAVAIFKRELVGIHFQTALESVIAHAQDPEARTPAAIKRPFKPLPAPKAGELSKARCPEHIGELPIPYCRIHATADALADYDLAEADAERQPPRAATDRTNHTAHADQVRAQIATQSKGA